MKKTAPLICIFLFILTIASSCGQHKRPDGMSKEVYELGMRAVKLIDDYHTGKITSSDVNGPLESIVTRLEEIKKEDEGKQTAKSNYGFQNSDYANYISYWISSFIQEKDLEFLDGDTYNAYDNLCRLLGMTK